MERSNFLLGLLAGLLLLLSCNAELLITDMFTVQSGSSDGGCDTRLNPVLDNWLSECTISLDKALEKMDDYGQEMAVRRSMSKFFGFKIERTIGNEEDNPERLATFQKIRNYIDYVKRFLDHAKQRNGEPVYNRDLFWLHCDSTFLTAQSKTDRALDFQAKEMKKDDKFITIEEVASYQKALTDESKSKPWWSGKITDQNGYYFTEKGGDYCQSTNLGVTAAVQPLVQDADGHAVVKAPIAGIILCPYSFDNDKAPNSYLEANNLLAKGVALETAVPKSATLLHEVFHALHGDKFLSGDKEKCAYTPEPCPYPYIAYLIIMLTSDIPDDIAECMKLKPDDAQANPENYVFFIAHMFHKFGEEDEDEPWSIKKNWDFSMTRSKPYVYGAS
ncbi:hypothetical protein CSUB01_09792 [Colletotrichum sublineola]|uniref:Lysine-specific metallo-endopeptidase domain-containing protein n=1 Tax=Colletotrichum sublineola TaxID=1173701 RepID=A0A066XXV0_COLSU|nr:hypothetical protein CSUB01_09792 [Colletotrichum sublineola]